MANEGIAIAILLLREVEHLMDVRHEGTDLFKQAVSNVTGIPVEEVTAEQRRLTKEASFGSRYGRSFSKTVAGAVELRATAIECMEQAGCRYDDSAPSHHARLDGVMRTIMRAVQKAERKVVGER